MKERDGRLRDAIIAMNALPDISGEDSPRLQEFVRVTTREVEIVGGASAGTTLEMIGYIRELEHAATRMRDACVEKVREMREDYEALRAQESHPAFAHHYTVCRNTADKIIEALEAAANPVPKDSEREGVEADG